jgi:hypothetical protein
MSCNPIIFPGNSFTVNNTGGSGEILALDTPTPSVRIKPINAGANITITTLDLGVPDSEYIEISTTGAASLTLQDAYDNSTAGEIILDTTRNAVNIQGDVANTVDPLFTVDRGSGPAANGDYLTVGQDYLTAASGSISGTVTGSIVIGDSSVSDNTNNHLFGPSNNSNGNEGITIFSDNTNGITAQEPNKLYIQKDNGLLLTDGPLIPTFDPLGVSPPPPATLDGNINTRTSTTGIIANGNNVDIGTYLSNAQNPYAYHIKLKIMGIETPIQSPAVISYLEVETIGQYNSLPLTYPLNTTSFNAAGLSVNFTYDGTNNIVANLINTTGVPMKFYIVEETITALDG